MFYFTIKSLTKLSPTSEPRRPFLTRREYLPPGLLEKMAFAESSWNINAVSPKGASGLMQLMPGTARRFHVDDPTDPKQAIEGAGRYMRWLLDRYDGNLEKAVAAYNAGEGRVADACSAVVETSTASQLRRLFWVHSLL